MKKNLVTMYSPLSGVVKSLKYSQDEAVAKGLLGRGILIEPSDNKIYAPCDCEVVLVYETKHAVILKSKEGLAILIHVGMNTAKLKGKGFTIHVKDNEKIRRGDLIMEFNPDMIIDSGLQMVVPFVFPNLVDSDFMAVLTSGDTKHDEPLINIKKTR